MKKRYAFVSMVVMSMFASVALKAQDYQPLSSDSRKLFATPDKHTTFGIAFDSTTVNGSITTYHNYKTVWDTLTPSNCGWWGFGECQQQSRPTWAGPRIERDDQGAHTMFNLLEEPITFAFSTEPGSQTLMYVDNDEQFLLSYVGESPMEVLGLTENVRQWAILHEDLGGQPIDSDLNNALVEVGENVGLIRYFRVDSFPLVLQPVELVGQSEPPLGLHTITPAFLCDFQPGDVVQTHYYANYYTGPPWLDYNSYDRMEILSRTDLPTEVSYEVETVTYNVDSATEVTNTSTVSYSKVDTIATIPFDRFDGTQPSLGMEDYCGLSLWTYRTYLNTGLAYCADENCWGPYDTNGPPPVGGSVLVGGLGNYASSADIWNPSGYNTFTGVVYFEKDGVVCMDEVVMGMPDVEAATPLITIAPVPADGGFTYRSSVPLSRCDVMDAHGRRVPSPSVSGTVGSVDTSSWPPGLYFMRSTLRDGRTVLGRVMVSR